MSAGFFQALAAADERVAVLDDLRAQIVAAAGFYDCPCGASFELDEGAALEDYAALNRWLGAHADGGCRWLAAEKARVEVEKLTRTGVCQSLELTDLRMQLASRGKS